MSQREARGGAQLLRKRETGCVKASDRLAGVLVHRFVLCGVSVARILEHQLTDRFARALQQMSEPVVLRAQLLLGHAHQGQQRSLIERGPDTLRLA